MEYVFRKTLKTATMKENYDPILLIYTKNHLSI